MHHRPPWGEAQQSSLTLVSQAGINCLTEASMNECTVENLDGLKRHICFFNPAQTQTNELMEEVETRLVPKGL